jgi:hypothetical protein
LRRSGRWEDARKAIDKIDFNYQFYIVMMNVTLLCLSVALLATVITLLVFTSRLKKKRVELEDSIQEVELVRQQCRDLEEASSSREKEWEAQLDVAQKKCEALGSKYSPITDLEDEKRRQGSAIDALRTTFQSLNEKYQSALAVHTELEKDIELYQETLDINSYGLYQPRYNFDLPEQYMVELEGNYQKQREMVKAHTAATCSREWLVDGSKVEGRKMTNQVMKLMLFAFSGDCEALIAKVRWNNVSKSRERMIKSYHEINTLGSSSLIEIAHAYFDLKLDELSLTYEYERKKHEQKEEQRLIREQMREEEKTQRELEKVHREAEEEAKLYQKVLDKARQELGLATKEEAEVMSARVRDLEEKLKAAQERKERAISLAQTTKVGNIYVISNIGSFGEGVFKIGMTRRFDPMDRIRELSDAALPFQFDVHAVIYSENAPQFERDLHKKFWDKRINLVNNRKEFFKVTLEEIEQCVIAEGRAEIQFTWLAEAREYRETLSLVERSLGDQKGEGSVQKYPASLMDADME